MVHIQVVELSLWLGSWSEGTRTNCNTCTKLGKDHHKLNKTVCHKSGCKWFLSLCYQSYRFFFILGSLLSTKVLIHLRKLSPWYLPANTIWKTSLTVTCIIFRNIMHTFVCYGVVCQMVTELDYCRYCILPWKEQWFHIAISLLEFTIHDSG